MRERLELEDALLEVAGWMEDARDSVKRGWSRETHCNCYKLEHRPIAGITFDMATRRRK